MDKKEKTLHADLRKLTERRGPFVSLYLDTEASTEDGRDHIRIRYKSLRDKAEGAGADAKSLNALDDLVDGAHRRGPGLAAIAGPEGIVLSAHLGSPVSDAIVVGPIPHLLPLLAWRDEHPTYAVVVATRAGGEIVVVQRSRPTVEAEVQTDEDVQLPNAGGWSQPRYQRAVKEEWKHIAKEVAEELRKVVVADDVEFVILTGDVRAVELLREQLPKSVAQISHVLEGSPEAPFEEIRERVVQEAVAYVARKLAAILDRFQEERGQHDLAADGVEATFEALRRASVGRLLVTENAPQGNAWFSRGTESAVALKKETLTDIGLSDVEQGDLIDVLVRGALGTGANVSELPALSEDRGPKQGVGALLRYDLENS
jgi:peptide subunit release factor 1 (eRF1)